VDGLIEGAVDDGEVGNLSNHAKTLEPEALVVVELIACPLEGGRCDGVHGIQGVVFGGVLVVVSLHSGATHVADYVQACDGIRVVTHDIAETDVICHALGRGIGEDGLESLEIGMDVTE
jgi:hypothetical protein